MITSSRSPRQINWFPFTQKMFNRLDALLALRHGAASWKATLRRLFIFVLFSSMLLPAWSVTRGQQPRLKIQVTTPPNTKGDIAFLIFASRDGFPDNKAKAVHSGFQPASTHQTTIDAGPLAPGQYAVSVYLDANGNHHLDRGLFGIPKEPVGASNNPKPSFGPPHFDQCAFQMNQTDKTISISLVSPK
jgi:uncharacterized protein (DUF2141 family)